MRVYILRSFLLIPGIFLLGSCDQSKTTRKYFEGAITYKHEVFPIEDSLSLFNQFSHGTTLSFKDGNFFHKYEDGIYSSDVYIREENKMYIKKRGSDSILIIDCGITGSKIISMKLIPNKETILGIKCNELTIIYKEKTIVDYYNSDTLSIDPDWFKEFKFDDEYITDQKEKSIFLKRKIIYPEFTIIQTATNISSKPVNSKLFSATNRTLFLNPN